MATMKRINIRIDETIKANAQKAAALEGRSLTEFLVRLIDKRAKSVIRKHQTLVLDKDSFERLMAACENAGPPNEKLLEAKAFADKQGFK